ncbi:hypothetical protein CB1_000094002 [Camelus ferus]|nr:hypothetical protein CB1_000094002 [Camelus ferus]
MRFNRLYTVYGNKWVKRFRLICSARTASSLANAAKKERGARKGGGRKSPTTLYRSIFNVYEDTLLILVSKDFYKLQILKEMAVWMNEDSSYLQERAMVIISRVLSFASRKVKGYSVGKTLLPSLLTDFVWTLLMKLSVPDPVTASEAAAILKLTLEYHAPKVTMVSKIVDAIYKQLRANASHAMKQAMLRVITLLTRTSPKKVIFQLMDYPVPADNYACDALRVLLNCSGLQQVNTALQRKNCWNQFSQVLFHHHGVYLVAKTLSEYNFPQFPETLHYLYKLSVEGPRRSEDSVITIIFLTELLNNFFKDPFPEEFLVLFRNWVNDSDPAVSKLSLQKIASMAPVINEIENVSSLLLSIVDAFLSKDKTVVIRAFITLRSLLVRLDKVTYSSLCARIASSYCPLMDHSNGGIRSMAIRHFGELLRDMSHYTWMLNDVVFRGLVPLILFLEDTEARVVKACKHTLGICASELKWSTSYLFNEEYYSFELVVLNICNNLVSDPPGFTTVRVTERTLKAIQSDEKCDGHKSGSWRRNVKKDDK